METDRGWMGAETSDMGRLMHLAIIPARSGSKGLKDKNILKLHEKHLIGYTIEAAIESGIFDCVHVSTDNKKYAEIAGFYGADVSFLRPKELSTDTADTWDVVRYVIKKMREMGKDAGMVTLLQPTSPFRTAEDLKQAYQIYKKKQAESVISVCEADHSPQLMKPLNDDLSMENFIDLSKDVRRQDQVKYYRLNGAIYMCRICVLDDIKKIYGKKSYAYLMPAERSVDIDTIQDFKYAEFLLQYAENRNNFNVNKN